MTTIEFNEEFLEFLRTNHSTDYIKAISKETDPKTLSNISNAHSHYFSLWVQVPSAIRQRYNGRIPHEIIVLVAHGNTEALKDIAAGQDPRKQSTNNLEDFHPEPAKVMATSAFLQALQAGFSQEASYELSRNHMFRQLLSDRAFTNSLTPEEKLQWRKTREEDAKIIKKDWTHCQPEKMLIHLFAKFNAGKISKEEFLPQVVDLMQKIETEGHHEHLLEYLKKPTIRAKLAHFKADVLDTLSQTVLNQVPVDQRDEYLHGSIPIKMQIRKIIKQDNRGEGGNLAGAVNAIVEMAKKSGVGLDLTNYTTDSHHPMSADLRQMFMVACCVHNVAYRNPEGEKINPSSDYFKSLPRDIQTLAISRDLQLGKEKLYREVNNKPQPNSIRGIPSVVLNRNNSRSVA